MCGLWWRARFQWQNLWKPLVEAACEEVLLSCLNKVLQADPCKVNNTTSWNLHGVIVKRYCLFFNTAVLLMQCCCYHMCLSFSQCIRIYCIFSLSYLPIWGSCSVGLLDTYFTVQMDWRCNSTHRSHRLIRSSVLGSLFNTSLEK